MRETKRYVLRNVNEDCKVMTIDIDHAGRMNIIQHMPCYPRIGEHNYGTPNCDIIARAINDAAKAWAGYDREFMDPCDEGRIAYGGGINLYEATIPNDEYPGPFYVNVYDTFREYGGSEEGGWYYTRMVPRYEDGCAVPFTTCPTYKEAVDERQRIADRMKRSNINDGFVRVVIERAQPTVQPKYGPYYC